jgi:hypothetical protein
MNVSPDLEPLLRTERVARLAYEACVEERAAKLIGAGDCDELGQKMADANKAVLRAQGLVR